MRGRASARSYPLSAVAASELRDVNLIRHLWYIFSSKERIEGAILLCAMALGALFEAISIGLIVPFIAVVKDPALVLNAPIAQPLLSVLNIHDPPSMLIALGLGLVAAFVIKSGCLVLLYRWQFHYVFAMQVSLTRQFLTGCLTAPYGFHLKRNSAELLRVTTQTIARFCNGFLISLLIVLGELLVVAALITLLVLISPFATLGAVLALGLPTILIYRLMQHRLAEAGQVAEESMASMIQWTEQAIGGIKEILVTDRAGFFIDRQGQKAQRFVGAMRSMMLLSSVPRLVTDALAVTAMVAIVLIILARGQDPQSVLPLLGMFAVAAIRLMPSVTRIANGLAQLRFHYAASEGLYNELHALDGDRTVRRRAVSGQPPTSPFPFGRSLVLDHLSYRYPSMPGLAIDDVSLEIPRGHWVGLIGPTGAGKTTLVDLVLGLFVPSSGRILIDGRDLQEDVAGWQHNIGYVPQSIYLMDDTVRRNVAFGLHDQEIDDERVWQALRAAEAETMVRALPGGLGAMIGERGGRLSGGERQRLGIARALYRDPQVLVVDEATANLDNETEAAIVHTLDGLRGEKTIIVIAHRLGMVKDCDCIYLLKGGRLHNSGRLSDLFPTDPAFREIAGSVP